MRDRFRYTDKQWAEIARELPEGADAEQVREFIEHAITNDRGKSSNPKMARKKVIQRCRNVSTAALKLHNAIIELEDFLFDAEDDLFEGFPGYEDAYCWNDDWVECLKLIARNAQVLEKRRSRRGRAACDYRNEMINTMILAWVCAGGECRASGAGNGAKDGGPLVRFLLTASKPVNVQPALTVNSAREIVRKTKPDFLTFPKRWERSMTKRGDN